MDCTLRSSDLTGTESKRGKAPVPFPPLAGGRRSSSLLMVSEQFDIIPLYPHRFSYHEVKRQVRYGPERKEMAWSLVCPANQGIGFHLTWHLLQTTKIPVVATTRKDIKGVKKSILDD